MRVSLHPAFVVHRRPYRETSILLEVLARDHGRVGLVARGARRGRSPLRGLLQPFRPLLASWSGRGELATLSGAEPAGPALVEHGESLLCGLYVNELIYRMLRRGDPHPELFDAYTEVLAALGALGGEGSAAREGALRVFEKRLLDATGYGLVLAHDGSDGAPLRPDREYLYVRDRGALRLGVAETVPAGVPVSGASLLALAMEDAGTLGGRSDAKRLMRHLLGPLLGERPLVARRLFRTRAGRARSGDGDGDPR